jgi:hypothetical protein
VDAASALIALTTMHQLQRRPEEKDPCGQLSRQTVQLTTNRPLTTDIAERTTWLENHFSTAEFEPDLTLPVTTPGGPDG